MDNALHTFNGRRITQRAKQHKHALIKVGVTAMERCAKHHRLAIYALIKVWVTAMERWAKTSQTGQTIIKQTKYRPSCQEVKGGSVYAYQTLNERHAMSQNYSGRKRMHRYICSSKCWGYRHKTVKNGFHLQLKLVTQPHSSPNIYK